MGNSCEHNTNISENGIETKTETETIINYELLKYYIEEISNLKWNEPNANTFKVRNIINKDGNILKKPSDPSIFKLVGIYKCNLEKPIKHIGFAIKNNNVVKNEDDFIFAIQFMIPKNSYIIYFKCKKTAIYADSLMYNFFVNQNTTSEFRNNAFKLIPHIIEGNKFIKMAVTDTPCLIGNKLKQYYYINPNYFEIDVDISSSSIAKNIVDVVIGYSKHVVLDMGFCLQGPLPEILLGSCQFNKC